MIVDDSFSRLTRRMIVHDSFSVSCFGNRRPDSGQYFLKCFTVHAEPDFVVSGSVLDPLVILPPIFIPLSFLLLIHYLVRPLFHQLFPDSSSVHTSNRSITRKQAVALFRRENSCFYSLSYGRHLVFTFLRGNSVYSAAPVTLFAALPVNYRQLSRTSSAV